MSDFHTNPKTCKARTCIWCGEPINKGDEHVTQSGSVDVIIYRNRYHPECWDAAGTDPYILEDGFDPYGNNRGSTEPRSTP